MVTTILEFILLLAGIAAGFTMLAFLVITAIWLLDDYWFAP